MLSGRFPAGIAAAVDAVRTDALPGLEQVVDLSMAQNLAVGKIRRNGGQIFTAGEFVQLSWQNWPNV